MVQIFPLNYPSIKWKSNAASFKPQLLPALLSVRSPVGNFHKAAIIRFCLTLFYSFYIFRLDMEYKSILIWSISLYGNCGWFSYLFHIPFDPLYLASTAMWAVTGVNIWSMILMSFLIMLSAFRSIPQEVREASEVDGLTLSQFYFSSSYGNLREVIRESRY